MQTLINLNWEDTEENGGTTTRNIRPDIDRWKKDKRRSRKMYISAHAHHSDERGQSGCDARIAHSAHRAPTELPQMRTRLHRADTKRT